MFKKSANQEEEDLPQNLSAFDSSTKAFKKPKHIVPQQSISNMSMMNPVPAAADDSVNNQNDAIANNAVDVDNQAWFQAPDNLQTLSRIKYPVLLIYQS